MLAFELPINFNKSSEKNIPTKVIKTDSMTA